MMQSTSLEKRQLRVWRLKKAVITLAVIVAAQVVVLEMVLQVWQDMDAVAVFAGIGASALLCALAVIIFLRTQQKSSTQLIDI